MRNRLKVIAEKFLPCFAMVCSRCLQQRTVGIHNSFIFFMLLAAALFLPAGQAADLSSPSKQQVYIIPVAGDVDPGMSAYIKRALRDIAENSQALFVFEMDTFGGRVDSALQIVDTLVNIPKGRTIAFVSQKAISAGALIALACNDLVMRPNTTIGDCAPISFSQEGPKMMGEKFQSPLRAKFRTLARRNGYPAVLAESMVTAEMAVYRVEMEDKTVYMDSHDYDDLSKEERDKVIAKKTVVAKGELLTMDNSEAEDLGFSRMTAASIEDMLQQMGVSDYQITRVEEMWSESLVRLIGKFAPILLMVGLAALYTEFKAPGFGVPGIVGIVCLSLVFFNQYLVGLADYTELLLLVLGLLLLAVEIFVLPGFGIAGISGILLIMIGMILSFQDFVLPDPSLPWQQDLLIRNITQVLGSFLVAFLAAMGFLRFVLPRMGAMVEGPFLQTTLMGSHDEAPQRQEVQLGDRGIAVTFLRPSGKVRIGEEVYDVLSEGDFIEKGAAVKVVAVKGKKIVVGRWESV